ncbi:uncharacterized protein LOC116301732 isoform X2 [Actinia tenebrosa]|uniref:Uncharacterized protein LOC116301732 isoform X2 n=1 Tax=Actinia tenebrosa TaxID=6105 RepID=A0A6P8IJS5_ACTTE|nr:uncharacterized protein LOC116301732 isoform X2 [Actinia tenebrosa]
MWRILAFLLVVIFRLSECKVRLAGGSSSSEGRVEIFHNGRWGTICDDNWDIDDARVVCRSLGLPDAIGATTLANFGQGSGEILLDEVQCRGNELSLSDCRHDGWGENNCGHGEDAGVVCGHPDVVNINVSSLSGVIRSPGYPQHMQRANYEWTFRPPIPNPNVIVCFDDLDLRTYSDGSFRATVQDSSNTELFFLKNSKHKGVCVIIESAGGKVIFYASLTPPKDDRGSGFRMRYAAIDRSQAEGHCSDGWDISAKGEAGRIDLSWKPPPKKSKSAYKFIVVYNSSASNVRANLASSTSVVIDNLDPSREYSIRVIAIPLTNEQSSALYSCTKRVRTKKEKSRVTDGKSASEGYVQVYHAGQWTRVCGNYWWDINDANVACRSMGLVAAKHAMVTYPKITKKGQHILLGNSISKLWLSGLRCTGREKSLLGCRTIASLGWTKFCYNDAGLVCKKPPVTSNWRLFDGMFPNEGLLEVYHNGEWGRVCSKYGWNMNSSKVACRSLGLPAPPFVLKYVRYWRPREEGSLYIRPERKTWIKNPSCDGTEKSLADCRNGEMKKSICRYSTGYLNLVCGLPKVQQIYINDTSGVITSPGHPWYTKQAHMKWIFKPAVSADAKVLLYFDMMDLRRNYPVSNERTSLSIHDGINTTLFYMENKLAKLTAVMGTSDVIVSFFSSFTYVYDGRALRRTGFRMRYLIVDKPCHENWNISVEVKPGRILVNWDALDENSGHRDLKYKYVVMYNSTREQIKTVLTSGTSVDIDYLPPNTLYSVGVLAYPSDATKNSSGFYFCSVKDFHTHKATTRLVGGKTPLEGHIQVFHQGIWGTICEDKDYGVNDARVACRSMGLPDVTYYKTYLMFGRGKEKKKWLRALKCKGNETSLGDCKHAGWGNTRWCYNYDAGVVCGNPSEQHFTITNSAGAIMSPGFSDYMPMMHHVYHFPKPATGSNAKLILYLDTVWLDRKGNKGESSLTIKDGTNTQIYQAKNKNTGRRVLEITSWPVSMDVYSSFTVREWIGIFGVNIPFIVVNESCRDWNISLTGKSGMILVDMEKLSKSFFEKYQYVTFYNSSTMVTKEVKENDYSSETLYSLEPKTLYTVSVFGFPYKYTGADKSYHYCTKNVRTEDVKLRLTGGKFPNEGRLEMLYVGGWGTICEKEWDIKDAAVACRSMGLPKATHALKQSEFGHLKKRSMMNKVNCTGNETSLGDCPHYGWKFWLENERGNERCSSAAGVVCGHPNVTSFNITSLTDMLTSPGFPKSLDQANYEWTFTPPMLNASILLCIEQLDVDRGTSGERRVSVIDRSGRQLLDIKNGKTYKRTHVLIQNNPSKLSFFSPFTLENSWSDKGFRMRYFVFNESCKGNWNVTVQKNSGNIKISWSLMDHHTNYTYAVVYYPTSKNIKSQTTRIPSVMMDYLEPNTEYTIRLFAFVPQSKELNFCSRRVRTDAVQWRIVGGQLNNEGVIEVNYKNKWGAVCADHLWDLKDATVACRYLGLPKATYAPKYGEFRTENTKFWLNYLQCLGNETSLENCYHRLWKSYNCLYPAGVVCGDMTVERHNITDQAGFINSPGYPYSMIQAHHEWTFIPANQNTRVLMEFLHVDLKRYLSGKSEMKVEDNEKNLLLNVKNTKIDTRQRFLVNKPTKMTYFSSFTSKYGAGMRMRYVMFDDTCSSNWSIKVKSGIGKMDVSWTPQSRDSEYNYLIVYNGTFNKSNIVDAHSPGATIDYLPPNTVYKVTVLALLTNNTVTKHCTRYVRTKPEPLRVVGGRIPSEGRVEIYNNNYWGVICEDNWDMDDARVACRQAGFPPPTWVFNFSPFLPPKKRSTVLGPLQCNGSETSIFKCPVRKDWCFNTNPASLVCGKPAKCKTEIQNSLKGNIQWDDYFNDREVECEWTITAPTKSSPIIMTLKKMALNHYSPCSKNYMIYVDALGREVERYCKSSRGLMTFVAFGFLKIRLRSDVS